MVACVNRVWNLNISSFTDIRLVNPPSLYGKGHSADQVSEEKLFILLTSIRFTHAKISSINFLKIIRFTFSISNIMKRHDVTYRISVRLSHVCETDRPPSLSPKASANLSTHWTISCANRTAVAFASTIVYTMKRQYYIQQ